MLYLHHNTFYWRIKISDICHAICSQFLIWCVMSNALVVVRKLFEIWIDSIPLIFTHVLIFWHSVLNELLKFFTYFVPSHFNYNKYHVRSWIHQFLLSCMFNVFAFYQCHHFYLLPISMPLLCCLLSCFCRSSTSITCTSPSYISTTNTFPSYILAALLQYLQALMKSCTFPF